jgi:type 1 glutamine amidotransferase
LPAISAGITAVQKIGDENNIKVDVIADSTYFTEENLKKYAAVIFISAGPRGLDTAGKIELQRFIEAGGGFVGVHSISYGNWQWYAKLMGAVEKSHPEPQEAIVTAFDRANTLFQNTPDKWVIKDEFYNFRDIQSDLNILLTVDESSYMGGELGKYHPMCWYHEYDGGRAFYMAFGHFSYHYTDAVYLKYLTGGIKYAVGNNVKLDYSKVSTPKYGKL